MMNTKPESLKLVELHAKTDRQLVRFITSRLEVGLNSAGLIASLELHNQWTSTETLAAGAEKAYEEVRALLPWVDGVTWAERRRLESQLEQLRELLNGSSIHAGLRTQAACS